MRADRRLVHAVLAFTAPWPGPGNSEGPPNGFSSGAAAAMRTEEWSDGEDFLSTDPWPGPGDSEGAAVSP